MQTLKEQLIKVKDKSKGKQLLQNNNFLELFYERHSFFLIKKEPRLEIGYHHRDW